MAFVDLDRAFAPLTKGQEANVDAFNLWGGRLLGWLDWSALLQRRRVVLLAEASSGKTEEFRYQQRRITAEGKFAFYLRIEELAESGFEAALDAESARHFEAWRDGTQDGWFFLDSVDEARLNRKNFEAALKGFARELGAGLERAFVSVSCRASDWKGSSDSNVIDRWLPAYQRPALPGVTAADQDAALLWPIFDEKSSDRAEASVKATMTPIDLSVVQLVPLSKEQYRRLSVEAKTKNVEAFIRDIERHGLEAFAQRPGDLLDLVQYWNTHDCFGTFADMVAHGIKRKLEEYETGRPDNETLAPVEAWEGAARIAAALTLGKSFVLHAPGHDIDVSATGGAIETSEVLPEWTEAKRAALLRRGVFAPATYGRIRFHHRSTQEYLAARWLHQLLKAGCPIEVVTDLLFVSRYEVETVVPSLRPVAAWLALWHPEIIDGIIKREPLLLIQYGDARSLSVSVRENLLKVYARKQDAGELGDDQLDSRSLWMFADEGLSPGIRRAWDTNKRSDFHFDLLRLMRDGSIKGTTDLAAGVALDSRADDHHRIVALQALKNAGDATNMKRVANEFLTTKVNSSARLASGFVVEFYPAYITTTELLDVIATCKAPHRNQAEGFGYSLKGLCDSAPNASQRQQLLEGFANLAFLEPFKSEYQRVSRRHRDIAEHADDLAHRELAELNGAEPPAHLVRLLMATERVSQRARLEKLEPPLFELVRRAPLVNRALFWADADEHRQHADRTWPLTRYWQILASGGQLLWRFGDSDLPWLNRDLTERALAGDRVLALTAIVEILRNSGLLPEKLTALRIVASKEAALAAEFDSMLAPPIEDPEMRRYRLEHEAHQLERATQTEADKRSWVKFRDLLRGDPTLLRDSKHVSTWASGAYRLHHLTRWLSAKTKQSEDKAAREWRLLEEGFGRPVAEAYCHGMRSLWRHVKPERPKRQPNGALNYKHINILAFAGLAVDSAEDPEWALKLIDKEALRAAQHGCFAERDYPEWLDSLLSSHPDVVVPLVKTEIAKEWGATVNGISNFLWHYGVPARTPQKPVQKVLLDQILKSEAGNIGALDRGLRIVSNLQLDDGDAARVVGEARARFRRHVPAAEDYAVRYVALMMRLDGDAAFADLNVWLMAARGAKRKDQSERVLGVLFDNHNPLIGGILDTCSVATLEKLLRLSYSVIRPEDDVTHEGSFTPDARDHAEGARNAVLSALLDRQGEAAYAALERASKHPLFALRAHRFRELAHAKAERESEFLAWTPAEVLVFEQEHSAPARTGADLLRLVLGILRGIDAALACNDASSRPLLARASDEDEVQKWLAEQLALRAKRRYHVHREAEVAKDDKPDIIISSAAAQIEVAIEIKHGGKGWTGKQLEAALRKQLAIDYLKPVNRRHGILVVTHHRDRRWQNPKTKRRMTFRQLISWLDRIALNLKKNPDGPIEVRCVGINAWEDP
jgi:hypothetical protein